MLLHLLCLLKLRVKKAGCLLERQILVAVQYSELLLLFCKVLVCLHEFKANLTSDKHKL